MKDVATISLLAMVIAFMPASCALADAHGQPPTVRIPMVKGRVQLDGRLQEDLWKKAAVCKSFVTTDGKTPAKHATAAHVMVCGDHLCVGFVCKQPNLPLVEVTERDGEVYRDDSVEVFLDVGCTGKRYYHVLVNAANVVRDEINAGKPWDAEIVSDTVRATDGWACEILIPLAAIGLTEPCLTPIGLNLCRNDIAIRQHSSWAGLAGEFHQPAAFGLGFVAGKAPPVELSIVRVEPTGDGKAYRFALQARAAEDRPFSGAITVRPLGQASKVGERKTVEIPAGRTWTGAASTTFEEPGRYAVLVLANTAEGIAGAARATVEISTMEHQAFGYPLSSTDVADVWWCEGTYKVGRTRPAPTGASRPVRVEAARHEYEPVQVVLRAKESLKRVNAAIEGLPHGVSAEICWAHYVKVTTPTDAFGSRDWYPDALVPLAKPIAVTAGHNIPLWITFYVSPEAKAGDHACTLKLAAGGKPLASAPIALHVFDFTLPQETHTETAYGLHVRREWHGPLSEEQYKQVHWKYVENLARHRIACYRPTHPAEIGVTIVDAEKGEAKLDFAEYDRAARRCYDERKITTFNFPRAAVPGKIGPYKRGADGYDRLHRAIQGGITKHLAEKGWLKKAYAYWVDEPSRDRYAWVKEGMELLKRNCPGLRRLLTINHDQAPLPYFFGAVNLWVPLFSKYDHARARERQKLGETVWWYVCCGPRHPYPNNFIDHPAINHRIRFWMMEKYQVDGSLYWHTTYWRNKNPWQDPMSYRPKKDGTWGNGDGYLTYPPTREPSKTPVLDGPINTIRLAMLREGLEDREYFWLLRKNLGGKDHPALRLPDELVRDLTSFESDPRKLYAARRTVAEAIESSR